MTARASNTSRPYVTVVAGLPRSGTSLLMQALVAGGVPIFDADEAAHPWYETRRVRLSGWDRDALGCAVKLLEPCRWPPPAGGIYRFVVTRRNPRQQARSTAKFLRLGTAQGRTMAVGRSQVKAAELGIRRDQAALEAMLASYPDARTLRVRFEDLVAKPEQVVGELDEFVGPLDREAALATVIPRPTKCLRGMLEHDRLGAAPPAAPWAEGSP